MLPKRNICVGNFLIQVIYWFTLCFKLSEAIRDFRGSPQVARLYSEFQHIENASSFSRKSGIPLQALLAIHDAGSSFGDDTYIDELIDIALPNLGDVRFSKTSFQTVTPKGQACDEKFKVWVGATKDSTRLLNSADANFVLLPDGSLFCNINIDGRSFRCTPCLLNGFEGTDSSCVYVMEIDNSKMINERPDIFYETPKRSVRTKDNSVISKNERYLQDLDDGSVIDVMFMYTAAVIREYGSESIVKAYISASIVNMNNIFYASEIDVEAQVVALEAVDFEESSDYNLSVDFVLSDEINALRDSYGADLVFFVTMNDDLNIFVDSPNPVREGTDEFAYAILGYDLNDKFTIPIAFGHLFGCSVDYPGSSQDHYLPYAYAYYSETCEFETLMSDYCQDAPTIYSYSNPKLVFNDEYIGNAEYADCARVITESKLTVSQYRNSVNSLVSTPVPTPVPTVSLTPVLIPIPSALPEPIPSTLPSSIPTVLSTSSPTLAATPAFSQPITSAPMNTLAPTPVSNLALTPVPTAVPFPGVEENSLYTVKYLSILANQTPWTNKELDDIFASAVLNVLGIFNNGENYDVSIDSVFLHSIDSQINTRSLQTKDSTEVLYSVSNIVGAFMPNVTDALVDASNSGDLPRALTLVSANFAVTEIETYLVGFPEKQSSSKSDDTSQILTIILAIAIPIFVISILIGGCCYMFTKNRRNLRNTDEPELTQDELCQVSVLLPDSVSVPVSARDSDWLGVLNRQLPAASKVYDICRELERLYTADLNDIENGKRILLWFTHCKNVIKEIGEYVSGHQGAARSIDTDHLKRCWSAIENIRLCFRNFNKAKLFMEFISSRKMQMLVIEATSSLQVAASRQNILANQILHTTELEIDNNTSSLITALDETFRVDIISLAISLKNGRGVGDLACMDFVAKLSMSVPIEAPVLMEFVLQNLPDSLRGLQINESALNRGKSITIESKSISSIFIVRYDKVLHSAKTVDLTQVPFDKLQAIYLNVTWETYILSTLKSPNVVSFSGIVTSISEYTFISEYMPSGTLRSVLDNEIIWRVLTPEMRHIILKDAASGMAYLHKNGIYHRELSSHKVMLTEDYRAKIGGFEFPVTLENVEKYYGAPEKKVNAWMSPECLGLRSIGILKSAEKKDIYSYGVITFEVLAGFAGPDFSTPWHKYSEAHMKGSVIGGKIPALPKSWDQDGNVMHLQDHHDIMMGCLERLLIHRPTFADILSQFENTPSELITEISNE